MQFAGIPFLAFPCKLPRNSHRLLKQRNRGYRLDAAKQEEGPQHQVRAHVWHAEDPRFNPQHLKVKVLREEGDGKA